MAVSTATTLQAPRGPGDDDWDSDVWDDPGHDGVTPETGGPR